MDTLIDDVDDYPKRKPAPPVRPGHHPPFTLKEWYEHNKNGPTVRIRNPKPFPCRVDVGISCEIRRGIFSDKAGNSWRHEWQEQQFRTITIPPGETIEVPANLQHAFVMVQCDQCGENGPGSQARCHQNHDGTILGGGAPWVEIEGRKLELAAGLDPDGATQKVMPPPSAPGPATKSVRNGN